MRRELGESNNDYRRRMQTLVHAVLDARKKEQELKAARQKAAEEKQAPEPVNVAPPQEVVKPHTKVKAKKVRDVGSN